MASKVSRTRPRTLIITWAQNATPVHKGFLAALERFADVNGAHLLVIPGRYRNPTSRWSQADQSDQWWAKEVVQYLTPKRTQLCPNLALYADIRVQPTAARPLSGFEVFCGKNSGIFGHPKRALEVVPTATRYPRILATTGAVTVENYTDSKAGKKGHAHHVLGAIVVEIESDGVYHLRHVSAGRDGSFTDLDRVYTPVGLKPAPPALALTLGDLHVGREDEQTLAATKELAELVKPRYLVLHDVLDFRSRNHHARTLKERYPLRRALVQAEVEAAVKGVRRVSTLARKTVVVRSNHDEAFDRWLEDSSPHDDPENAPYYCAAWSRLFEAYAASGVWTPAFELEAKRLGVPDSVRFLRRDETFRLADVEYGFHGDRGINGARGTPAAYARLGVKVVTGHTHTPGWRDGACTVGVTAQLDHGYNGLPSTWLQTHCLQYADGKRTLITIVKGRFRGKRGKAHASRKGSVRRAA